MAIRSFLAHTPTLGARAYVDPAASVIGQVVLGDDVSIWPGCVVRGDVNSIEIGARTNVQDGSIVHVTHEGPFTRPGGFPTVIANDVTIGHGAVIHACRLEEFCLVGMGAIVLDGAVVSRYGFVGAGAVVSPGKTVGEAGSVSATVECLLDLADLSVPGVPGSRLIKATSSSPLDTWRERA